MKTFLLLALTIITAGVSYAQKQPEWVDPYKRESRYPANRFLVGLSSEIVEKGQSLAEIYKQLNQMSRNQIIESIHVNVKSETEMNISIVNTESTQLLDQNSVSISKAELVGLKFENYYDKKQKTAFSFSYVSIQELIDYNLDIIKTNTSTIDNNISIAESRITTGDKEGAIDLLFESQIKLREINQAAVILMALGQDDLLDFHKIGQMKLDIAKGTDDFFNNGTLNVHELASFYAYGLQLQIGDAAFTVCKGNIVFENSKNESRFSNEFKNRILNKLSDLETVKLGESGCDFTFQGNFSEANGKIVMVTDFVDKQGKVKATVNNKFPYQSVQFGDLDFLPENFEYIKDISSIKLETEQASLIIPKTDLFKNPIDVSVSRAGVALPDMPIRFAIYRGEELQFETNIPTDKNGVASLIMNGDQIKRSGKLVVKAQINVKELLDVDPSSEFYKKVMLEHPPYQLNLKVEVIAPTVFIKSNELNLGKAMEIQLLAPAIKKTLVDLDYKFVDQEEGADYTIYIEASTRPGQNAQYMYFSYLDATISMLQNSTDKEIYKNGLSSVKGGGSSYELASVKAYEMAIDRFLKDFVSKLGNEQ